MNTKMKTYLLNFIYEEVEKNLYNAYYRKDQEKMNFYIKLLKEIKSKNIQSEELKNILLNMKDYYKNIMIDMPLFIDNLLANKYKDDKNIDIRYDCIETPISLRKVKEDSIFDLI